MFMKLTSGQTGSTNQSTMEGTGFAASRQQDAEAEAQRQTVGESFVADPRMTARDVAVYYGEKCAIRGISIDVGCNEVLAMIGPSGCGKSTTGRCLIRLLEPSRGTITFEGKDVRAMRGKELQEYRREVQFIFQDPYSSLDPRMPIGESVMEGLNIHNIGSRQERFEMMIDTLKKVGLEDYHARRYPHEFSGGQRQRIGRKD